MCPKSYLIQGGFAAVWPMVHHAVVQLIEDREVWHDHTHRLYRLHELRVEVWAIRASQREREKEREREREREREIQTGRGCLADRECSWESE